MMRALQRNLASIKADPAITNNASLLKHRLALGASCDTLPRSRYVFLPAAIGERRNRLRLIDSSVSLLNGEGAQLARGGNEEATMVDAAAKYHLDPAEIKAEAYDAVMIDFSSWLRKSFTESDFVVLKMDVEGGEHLIIPKMIAHGTVKLVDVWLWECHYMPKEWKSPCHKLLKSLRAAGVEVIYQDPYPWSAKHS